MTLLTAEVIALKERHALTWRDKAESYWLAGLLEEVAELSGALYADHEHSPDWELKQIAAICMNWLEMREESHEH